MHKPFIHNDIDNKKINIDIFVCLVTLILYGFYKNGILPYQEGYIKVGRMFVPILYPLLGTIVGIIINYVYSKEFKINSTVIYGTIFGMIISINLNVFAFLLILILCLLVLKMFNLKIDFNALCIMKIFSVIALLFFNKYGYQNAMELSGNYSYNYFNMFFGSTVSGISISNSFLCLMAFIYLSFNNYYKKDIPLLIIGIYSLIGLIIGFINKDFSFLLKGITSGTIIFASIFIATDMVNSPLSKYGRIIYCLVIGVLTFIFSKIINNNEGVYIAILIGSFLTNVIDNLNFKIIRQKK